MANIYITDRTEKDVAMAKYFFTAFWDNLTEEEKEEWLKGLKGCFNYTDHNRLRDICNDLNNTEITTPNFSNGDLPILQDVNVLFENIKKTRSIFGGVYPRYYLPQTFNNAQADEKTSSDIITYTADKLDYKSLNLYEKDLEITEKFLNGYTIDFLKNDYETVNAESSLEYINQTLKYQGQTQEIECKKYNTLSFNFRANLEDWMALYMVYSEGYNRTRSDHKKQVLIDAKLQEIVRIDITNIDSFHFVLLAKDGNINSETSVRFTFGCYSHNYLRMNGFIKKKEIEQLRTNLSPKLTEKFDVINSFGNSLSHDIITNPYCFKHNGTWSYNEGAYNNFYFDINIYPITALKKSETTDLTVSLDDIFPIKCRGYKTLTIDEITNADSVKINWAKGSFHNGSSPDYENNQILKQGDTFDVSEIFDFKLSLPSENENHCSVKYTLTPKTTMANSTVNKFLNEGCYAYYSSTLQTPSKKKELEMYVERKDEKIECRAYKTLEIDASNLVEIMEQHLGSLIIRRDFDTQYIEYPINENNMIIVDITEAKYFSMHLGAMGGVRATITYQLKDKIVNEHIKFLGDKIADINTAESENEDENLNNNTP